MKKKLCIILLAFIVPNVFALGLGANMSFSFSPTSVFSLVPTVDENDNVEFVPLVGISFNFGETNIENDIFVSIYPNEYSIGYERRVFLDSSKQGFFHGLFASIDYRRFQVTENGVETSLSDVIKEDYYSAFGVRFGYEIGLRIRINDFGITPKVGIGVPYYLTCGLNKVTDDFVGDYINTLLFGSFFIGLKFDIF